MRIDKAKHKRLKLYAVEHEKTVTALFLEFMEEKIKEAEKKKSTK